MRAPWCPLPVLPAALLVLLAAAAAAAQEQVIMDRIEDCDVLVASGECPRDPERMRRDCPLACREWQRGMQKVLQAKVPEDGPSFFDLSARTGAGKTLSFDRFDGYLTIVTNVLKDCIPGGMEGVFASLEHLTEVWPYGLEIMVFAFDTPENRMVTSGYETFLGCDAYQDAMKEGGRRIHVMEEANINGPNVHPVYAYLKGHFDLGGDSDGNLPEDRAMLFVIPPDGSWIRVHFGVGVKGLKHLIAKDLEHEL